MIRSIKLVTRNNTPRWVVLIIDLIISGMSFGFACLLTQVFIKSLELELFNFLRPLLIILFVRLIAFWITRSYTGIVRYTSTQDAVRIFLAIALSTAILLTGELIFEFSSIHTSTDPAVIIIDGLISISALTGFRIVFKLLYNEYAPFKSEDSKELIVYGAGEAGIIVKRSVERNVKLGKKVVGFLDDNKKLHGKTVEGVKIYSPDVDFNQILKNPSNAELVIAINEFSPIRKKRIIERCLQYKMLVKTIPPVNAWINGEFNLQSIKAVRIEDLLEREPIKLRKNKISKELQDQVILITGAAGSIGSEIVRQCLSFNPTLVVLVDQGETPLYEIENELSKANIAIVVADVRNVSRMEKIFQQFKPSYVFHAAAYKHVPLMEDNPYEAINTNVFGTQNVANLAAKYQVKKFVFVSTDKAVNPTNIMGASKRIAEIYIQSLNAKLSLESDHHTMYITTRFGNVLGSNGSVIPLFRKQIAEGGPLTVTHPDITRYFMTIPEACQLVLEAGVMGQGGEIYIFDMGESVKIIDLAHKMINLSGFEVNKDIKITFTGLRPGEKLKEELLNDNENTIGTHNPKIMVARVPEYNYLEVNSLIIELYEHKDSLQNEILVKTMKKIVPEYISNNSIYEKLDS
ncbi:MAG: nucleoside-diphosphate sugar epimerase/dehydratase [Bacteroidetes bacterium]|nr:nucleoside-diphosphate sugar epimerase/dehydratase [Bacteroidota bacterium]